MAYDMQRNGQRDLLVAIIAGLVLILVYFWTKSKALEEKVEANSQVAQERKDQEEKKNAAKNKKKKQRKKNKKKGKQQEDAKAAEPVAEPVAEAGTKAPKNKSKKQNKKQSVATSKKAAATSKKANAVKPAPKPKKQTPPDDGGGWVTAGAKKKKQQPRGGYNPNAKKQEEFSTYVIPTTKVGILIGTKGQTLRDIEEKSGCKINLPANRSSSRKETTVTIIGEAAGRRVAKAVIKDFVELGFSPKLKPGMKMHNVSVSVSLLPVLRGNKFAALKALEEDGNVKISIPDPKGGAKSVRVKVAGSMRGIEKTKKNLGQLNLYYHCEATHPGFVHQVVYNCDLALLVGPRGQTIKSIQGDTKAKIYTPKVGSPNPNVVIVGSKVSVERALKQVQRVLGTDLKTLTTKAAPPSLDDDFYTDEYYE